MEFIAVFEKQKEGGYTVYVPSLPGCISEGETKREAMKNIKEAAQLYLEETGKGKAKTLFKTVSLEKLQVTTFA
ncbi:MAG: type II toxin-antitoxin system HicB family antitoxin [archaeon]